MIETDRALTRLNERIAASPFLAGWNRAGRPPMWSEPTTDFLPARWGYTEALQFLEQSIGVVPPELSERRNLILFNPRPDNFYATLRTLVAAYQMIVPGDIARSHHHSPHAGRVILESEGAYTVVDGVRIDMEPGDVVLTPSGRWHGHGHEGTEPAVWVDFLDVPLVQLLEPMFFEPHPEERQEWHTVTRDTPLLFSFTETKRRLANRSERDSNPYFERRIELGSPALPTIGLHAVELDQAGSRPYRTTANIEYIVIEGAGNSVINGQEFAWSRGDVIAVPAWAVQSHRAAEHAVLISVSDEPLQAYCGYLLVEDADHDRSNRSAATYRAG